MSTDFVARILASLRTRRYHLSGWFWTKTMRVWGMLTGMKIASSVTFYGRPRLRRFPGGSLRIADNCRLDSLPDKNSLGLVRPCSMTIFPDAKIVIGSHSGFGGTVIQAATSITIGSRVKIGANCIITDHEGHPDDPRSTPPQPIVIEDDVWLGMNVLVLKGVTIGRGSLVGANSVVTRDIPPYSVAVGSPARVVRTLPGSSE